MRGDPDPGARTGFERLDPGRKIGRLRGKAAKLLAARDQAGFVARVACDAFGEPIGRIAGKREHATAGVGGALSGDRAKRARERLLDEPR